MMAWTPPFFLHFLENKKSEFHFRNITPTHTGMFVYVKGSFNVSNQDVVKWRLLEAPGNGGYSIV